MEAKNLAIVTSNNVLQTSTKHGRQPYFLLCKSCFWCCSYFSNNNYNLIKDCPSCKKEGIDNNNNNTIRSIPIITNETSKFDYVLIKHHTETSNNNSNIDKNNYNINIQNVMKR